MDDERRRRTRKRRILGAIMCFVCTTIVVVVVLPIVLVHHKDNKDKTSHDVAIDNSLFKDDNLLNNSTTTRATQTNSISISLKPLIFDAILSNSNTTSEIPTSLNPSETADNLTIAPSFSTIINDQIYHNNQSIPSPTLPEITDILLSTLFPFSELETQITEATDDALSTTTKEQYEAAVIGDQTTNSISITNLTLNETESNLLGFIPSNSEQTTNLPSNLDIMTTSSIENKIPNNSEFNYLPENSSLTDSFVDSQNGLLSNSESGFTIHNSTINPASGLEDTSTNNVPNNSIPDSITTKPISDFINDIFNNLENPPNFSNGFQPNLDDSLSQGLVKPNDQSNVTFNNEANGSASTSVDNTIIQNEISNSISETTDSQQATSNNIEISNNKPIPNRCFNFNFINNK